jgi:hypothetical protein
LATLFLAAPPFFVLLLADFLADLFGVAAFCGVAWADPATWAGAAAATGAALLAALFPPFLAPAFLIFLDPAAFLCLLAPAALVGFALAIKNKVRKDYSFKLKYHFFN